MNAAVFDTNVLVSGILSPHGPPGWIVDALQQGECRAIIDDRIWDEYVEVMSRPAFGFAPDDVETLLGRIAHHAIRAPVTVEQLRRLPLPDPDDVPFLACALAMDVPLVTGNVRHFPRAAAGKIAILTPAAYVQRMRSYDRPEPLP
jgi:predicted nucleic acid-binding protein